MCSVTSHAPRYRHCECRRPHEEDPQGTRQNATPAARGLQTSSANLRPGLDASGCGQRSPLARAALTPKGVPHGTAHAPRLPRSTPPIKPPFASCISPNSSHWPTLEKVRDAAAALQASNIPLIAKEEDENALKTPSLHRVRISPFLLPSRQSLQSWHPSTSLDSARGSRLIVGLLRSHFHPCKNSLCDECDDLAVQDGDLIPRRAHRTWIGVAFAGVRPVVSLRPCAFPMWTTY